MAERPSVDDLVRGLLTLGQAAAGVLIVLGLTVHRPAVVWGLVVALATPLVALVGLVVGGAGIVRYRVFAALTGITLAIALFVVR